MKNGVKSQNRETWGSRFGFIMAAVGIAVGVGNIWRFPYIVGQNGGGAFIVAYLIILFLLVMPALMLEMGMGKLTGKGTIETYILGTGNKKLGTGLGIYISMVPLFINMFYIIIIGYALYYMIASVMGTWMTIDPVTVYQNIEANKTILMLCFTSVCIVNSYIVYKGISSGIEKSCKVMIPAIFIILGLLLVRGVTLPGFLKGLDFYMRPDWSYLGNKNVWLAAASQAMFSIGLGPGMMIVYGSHLSKKDDIALNSITVSFLDTAVAFLAGFAIIPATIALGLNPESGPSLIFIVLPSLFKLIPAGQILAILFFAAIFFAGLSSSISHLETPVTSFMDYYNWSRKKAVLIFTVLTFIGGTLCVYSDKIFNLINTYAGDYFYGLSTLIVVLVFGWKFGAKRVREEAINISSDIQIGSYYELAIKLLVTPILIFVVLSMFI